MKFLIFADSHRSIQNMIDAIEKNSYDCIVHLGDSIDDIEKIEKYRLISYDKTVYKISGNNDYVHFNAIKDIILNIKNKKILLTHGHNYGVKYGYNRLVSYANEINADIVLFGHTHFQDAFEKNNSLFLNPGSIGYSGTYVLLNVTENEINYQLLTV